jgi:hypothetical protein
MNEKVKNKIAKSIINLTKLTLYYDGVGFVIFHIEYPFTTANKTCELRINLGDKESWTFDMPAYGQLYDYLEDLFKIKDRETKDEIRELIIDEMESKVRIIRKRLLTP